MKNFVAYKEERVLSKQQFKMEAMEVAKIMFGADNNSFMHKNYPDVCPKCGFTTTHEVNENFKLVKKKYDVSCTLDGYKIVSKRFKDFCIERGYKNIHFLNLSLEPDFFTFNIDKVIKLNYERRNVQFTRYCELCTRYDEVIGADPSFIEDGFVVEGNSFYRSKYEFGSRNRKHALDIVSIDVALELSKQKFKGLYFGDVLP